MKNLRIKVLLIIIINLFIFLNPATSSASTYTQDNLEVNITTNKTDYIKGEEVKIDIVIINNNGFNVDSIQINIILPDGLKLKDISDTINIASLLAGENKTYTITAEAQEDISNLMIGNLTKTGGNVNLILLYTVLSILIIFAIIVSMAVFKKKPIKNKFLMLFISITFLTLITANAYAATNRKNLNIEENIIVDGQSDKIKVDLTYDWIDVYSFTEPGKISKEGITATVTFDKVSPQPVGTEVTATVLLSGSPTLIGGKYTIDLTSADLGLTNPKIKTTTEIESGNRTVTYIFTIEDNDLDDFIIELSHSPIEEGRIVGDGKYSVIKGVNTPKLANGMTPVAWDESNEEFTPVIENNWYSYNAQTGILDGKTSKWGNAKTIDGSYFVWIPRFEYKIDNSSVGLDYTKAGKIDIRFIDTNTKAGKSGYTTTNGITTSSDGYIIHPAFTSDVNTGGFGIELDGIWVAKYEMSREDSADSGLTWLQTVNIGNVATKNAGSSSYIRAVSKPGVASWREINIANSYQNSYNYDRAKESHLIKNSEWGALAYLTHSKYGRNGTEITLSNNASYYTGGDNGIAYKSNTAQSSTGNVTGIYDLRGNAYEYVAIFNKSYSGINFTGPNYVGEKVPHFATNGGASTKYVTAYNNNTSTYQADFTVGDVSHVGDGIHEVWVNAQRSWFSDFARYINIDSPLSMRGGCNTNGGDAGVFFSTYSNGAAYTYTGFRTVLAI